MKSLTKTEKITLLKKLFERIEKLNKLIDSTDAIGFPESKLAEEVWHIQDHAIEYAAALVEDPYEWVSWYVHECKLGKNKVMANVQIDGKNHKVTTVEKLVQIMEQSKENVNDS